MIRRNMKDDAWIPWSSFLAVRWTGQSVECLLLLLQHHDRQLGGYIIG